jgi:hypothetical protein
MLLKINSISPSEKNLEARSPGDKKAYSMHLNAFTEILPVLLSKI